MSDLERRIRLARLALELGDLFPLQHRGKGPLANTRGCLDAVADPEAVERWIRRGLNVGLHASRVFCLDVDARSDGDLTLAAYEREHGALPDTCRVLTGGGAVDDRRKRAGVSTHFYFALPDGLRWRKAIGPGLDIKAGPGAYLVAPPSIVAREYVWDDGCSPQHCELAEIPAWLLERAVRLDPPVDVAATGPVSTSVLAIAFTLGGLVRMQRDEKLLVRCPWSAVHSGKDRQLDSSTVIFAPSPPAPLGHFHCSHAHCSHLRAEDALATLAESIVVRAVALSREAAEKRGVDDDVEREAIQMEARGAA